jgi:CBS domain-containing protein
MDAYRVREVPVVDAGRLVGILTRSDLGPYVGQLEWTQVRTAMTPGPQTVVPEASVVSVARGLLAGGFNAIPVAVGDVLAGMISRQDLLRVLVDAWGRG